VVDGGWGGDEVITLGNVTLNSNTLVPQTGSAPTCNLPPATMQLTRTAGTFTGIVDETAIQANADYGSSYRIVGCNYAYNLAAKPLGPGTYKVQVLVNNTPAGGSGQFALK
jgi:hypothetical protein